MMRYSHAIISRVPSNLKLEKKLKADVELMRKQQEDLTETLRESGVKIVEVSSEGTSPFSLHTGDGAVVIKGTALICRPKKEGLQLNEISKVLSGLSWTVIECPPTVNGKNVVLEGSDVLYTGREVFVGIRKHGTNIEGAMVLARSFCDVSVVPINLSDKSPPLRQLVSLCAPGILAVGNGKEAANVLKRMEQEASFRYQILRIADDEAVNCVSVNGRIVFRQDKNEPKFTSLQSAGMELWALDVSELVKAGAPFSRYCLLVDQVSPKARQSM